MQATQVYSFEQTWVWAPANPQAIAQSVVFRCSLRGVISVLIYGVEKENICFFKFIGYLHKIKFLKVKKKKINYSLVTHFFPGFAVTCGWDFKLPVKNAWCLQWTAVTVINLKSIFFETFMKTLYLQHRYYSIYLLTTLFICCRASLIRYERMRALLKASSKNAEKCKCMRGQHATNCEKEMGAGSRQWANSELTPHARLASTGLMVWASSSNIKANLVIENRSRVHPPSPWLPESTAVCWMEL